MFIVLMHLMDGSNASTYIEGHKAWIRKAFDEDVLFYVGGRRKGGGNAMIANGLSHEELSARVDQNPLVANGVVSAEIIELDTTLSDPRMAFMVEFQGDRLGYRAESASDAARAD